MCANQRGGKKFFAPEAFDLEPLVLIYGPAKAVYAQMDYRERNIQKLLLQVVIDRTPLQAPAQPKRVDIIWGETKNHIALPIHRASATHNVYMCICTGRGVEWGESERQNFEVRNRERVSAARRPVSGALACFYEESLDTMDKSKV